MRRERSVLAAAVLLAGCAVAATAPAPPPEPPAASIAVDSGPHEIVWPGATARDLDLASDVIALTRRSVERLLPALGPLDGVSVRVVVTETPQAFHCAYRLDLREVRVERAYLDRLNFAHEIAHAVLHGRLGFPPPRWFDEAVAQLAAYEVVRGAPLPPPAGRPVSGFAHVRALDGVAWLSAGDHAFADSAEWAAYLLPSGPAGADEKAAFARYVEALAARRDVAVADRELDAVRSVGR